MKLGITRRAQKRIVASREHLENNFYPEYGRWFEDKTISTIKRISTPPKIGHEAFPEINRPEIRKILCDHYQYWIFYRVKRRLGLSKYFLCVTARCVSKRHDSSDRRILLFQSS